MNTSPMTGEMYLLLPCHTKLSGSWDKHNVIWCSRWAHLKRRGRSVPKISAYQTQYPQPSFELHGCPEPTHCKVEANLHTQVQSYLLNSFFFLSPSPFLCPFFSSLFLTSLFLFLPLLYPPSLYLLSLSLSLSLNHDEATPPHLSKLCFPFSSHLSLLCSFCLDCPESLANSCVLVSVWSVAMG